VTIQTRCKALKKVPRTLILRFMVSSRAYWYQCQKPCVSSRQFRHSA